MFLVTGITGHVGGAAARHLLDAKCKLRALVRDPDKAADWADRGVELITGDLTDAAALSRALDGVDGAFVLQPTPLGVSSDFRQARALNKGIVEALRRAPPPRLVVLSSVGSEQTSGLGNITQTHLFEQALDGVAFPLAIVRAGALLENNLQALNAADDTGVFHSWLQPTDRVFPMVATADIGAQVARLLTTGWNGQLLIELGTRRSPDELAAAMAQVLGHDVKAQPIPREEWMQRLRGMGLAEDEAAMWAEMQDGFNSGRIDFGVSGAQPVAGTTTPAEVFASAVG